MRNDSDTTERVVVKRLEPPNRRETTTARSCNGKKCRVILDRIFPLATKGITDLLTSHDQLT